MKKRLAVLLSAAVLSFVSVVPSFAQRQCVVGMLTDIGDNNRGYKVVYDGRMGRNVYVASHFRLDEENNLANSRRFVEDYFQVADLNF